MHAPTHVASSLMPRHPLPQVPTTKGMSLEQTVFTSLADEQPLPSSVSAMNSSAVNSALLPKHWVTELPPPLPAVLELPPSLSLPQPIVDKIAVVVATTSMK